MEKTEATRRANASRDYQAALTWHLKHNADLLERTKADAGAKGLGVRAILTKTGNIMLEASDEVEAGDLVWHPMIVDEVPAGA